MTDTQTPGPSAPERKKWNFWRSRMNGSHVDRPFIYYARRYDAQFYALIVAIGVPLMGWLVRDFQIPFTQVVVGSYTVKVTIAAFWMAITHEYWVLELDDIRNQIKEQGLLDVEKSDYQRSTMQSLYYGVVVAFFIWLIGIVVYIVTWALQPSPLWIGPSYGVVEVALLAHTVWVGRRAIKAIYPLISIIQQALAGQLRRETPAHT